MAVTKFPHDPFCNSVNSHTFYHTAGHTDGRFAKEEFPVFASVAKKLHEQSSPFEQTPVL